MKTGIFASRWLLLLCLIFVRFSGFSQVRTVYRVEHLELIVKKEKSVFPDSIAMMRYCNELRLEAYRRGYLNFTLDTIRKTDSFTFLIAGDVGKRYREVIFGMDDETRRLLKKNGIQPRLVSTSRARPEEIGRLVKQVLAALENNGYPFARVKLEGLETGEDVIRTQLKVMTGPEIRWTAVHIVGQKVHISEKFMANYLHINTGNRFSQEIVDLIPLRMKQIMYLKQTKPHELLFTPEGAELFLYLESKPVSLFNGTVGLQQNPVTFSYQLTGDLRLKLQNVLRRGELFDLNWRSIQPGSPQLKTVVSYPYLFNTPFGVDGQFQLFKRDSTFLELKSTLGINYFLSAGNTLRAFYRNTSSSLLNAGTTAEGNYATVKSNQYGLSLTHQTIDYLPNPQRGLIWTIEGSAGQRSVTKDTVARTAVFSGKAQVETYLPVGKRQVVKLGLFSETYYAQNVQRNELLRFGGNLSQRGFLEDELLATSRVTGTLEYRFLLDRNSYLFAFFDQSWYERFTAGYLNDHPYGFGAGLSFGTNIGIFSLTYALGSQQGNPILLRDSKIHFGYVAYF